MESQVADTTDRRPPHILADKTHLDLTKAKRTALTLSFAPCVWENDYYLVIDIYSAANHVHPQGHLGWWICRLAKPGTVKVAIQKCPAGLNVSFGEPGRKDKSWTSPDAPNLAQQDILAVHLVLRKSSNRAVAFDHVLYLHNTSESLKLRQASCLSITADSSDSDHTAVPWFCWPAKATAHLITRNLQLPDAISSFVVGLYRLFTVNNIPCRIYAQKFDPLLAGLVRHVSHVLHDAKPEDLIFYSFSIFDPYLADIQTLHCRKIFYYHNITPPRFFQIYDAEYAALCEKALGQIHLARGFNLLMANSHQTADQLQAVLQKPPAADSHTEADTIRSQSLQADHSLSDVVQPESADESYHGSPQANSHSSQVPLNILSPDVCPPILRINKWDTIEARDVVLPDHRTLLLYVGRIAPHKRIEHLIHLFSEYHRLDSDSALLIVGRSLFQSYTAYLHYLLKEQFPQTASNIYFLPDVSDAHLKTIYSRCSAFVTLSEHEGFCLPVAEAMQFDLPVFAYAQQAVQQTLGSSGKLIWQKDFPAIAAEIHQILDDPEKLRKMIAGQQRRLKQIAASADGQAIFQAIEKVMFTDAGAL